MQNDAKTCRSLEQVNIYIETAKSNVIEMEKKFIVNTDESDNIARIVASHSELICVLQNDGKEHVALSEKKIEQLKTMLTTLENDMITRSNKVKTIKSRVCNRYACYVELDHLTPVSARSIISTFSKVREYNGQHFNQTTGKFVSPHDGLYLVCVTLHEWGDKQIVVGVMAGDRLCTAIAVKCAATSAAGSVVVDMKKGQEIYLEVCYTDQGAKLSWFSSFTIVSL
ncbi:uncharacterized protein LOC131947364 [Physella acuta]|uniref:uncharacterized protein LOC131947364 n=1 Tax=Physella acuta TaxID=109671 RepID=UPI0027DD5480|nr:uncharacterized protein LOC131947364 [Physella acuta]